MQGNFMSLKIKTGLAIALVAFASSNFADDRGSGSAESVSRIDVAGLTSMVDIAKDKWGVSHIYAKNQADLFFAQGYSAARDRLFQFEIWRRKATGTLSEIMGKKAIEHDKGARLLRFRGDIQAEMAHYHADGVEIITSFVAGVNAYIKQTEKAPELLPFEFSMLGIRPGYWTPEVVVSRHNALTGGISNEIMLSKLISTLGEDKTRQYLPFYRDTYLQAFPGIDLTKIDSEIMASYRASRSMPSFESSDLAAPSRENLTTVNSSVVHSVGGTVAPDYFDDPIEGINNLGSNNWIIAGSKTQSGKPLMANDPHRTIQSPSLRYLVHLNAPAAGDKPGWNVIGAGEPVLPGISIGHNDVGAWGLTIFRIDQEDLYVYETNPDNPNQYRYNGGWKDMHIEETLVDVRGQTAQEFNLKYSIHGPVIFEDRQNNLAYGLKAAWLDLGAAPYLASLRMDQAGSWEEFREACSYSGLPGENMIWADKMGNIGWQSVGLSPVRFGWDGSLPIPGNGQYEWNGYIPIKSMPHLSNPLSGWYGTANNFNVPDGYPNVFSDFYSDPARIFRLREVMSSLEKHSIEDSMALQYDNKSMTAEKLVPMILALKFRGSESRATSLLKNWDYQMGRESAAAALYDIWEQEMLKALKTRFIPSDQIEGVPSLSRHKMLEWLVAAPGYLFGSHPLKNRDRLIAESLKTAVEYLTENAGEDFSTWKYGQFHYAEITHPLSHLLSTNRQLSVNIPPLARGGASNTLNANHGNRQRSGASFRIVVDTDDWDLARATNGPGQAADPRSHHYADLFEPWNKGEYFPLLFSKKKVLDATEHTTRLEPR
ncbi:MAG: penicillin amidase [Oceanicoccus sp.]